MLRLTAFFAIFTVAIAANLNVVYEWKYIDYVWETDQQKQNAINSGAYNRTNIFAIDMGKARDGRIFVTTPGYYGGVPATLSTVSNQTGNGGPLLQPYPDWSWNNATNCSGITTVYRIAIDECNRIWVLDSGKLDGNQVCSAQLLAFNLTNDKLVKRVTIPNNVSHSPTNKSKGLMINLAVETDPRSCSRTRVYMADGNGYGLVVWNGKDLWRINNDVFKPEASATTFTVAGENFNLDDGLFGLALSPEHRFLYFRPLASYAEYRAPLIDVARTTTNQSNFWYQKLDYKLPCQASSMAFSKTGTMFFGLVSETAIACWNEWNTMNDKNVVIVAQNETTLQFASGLKIQLSHDGEQLWVITMRIARILPGSENSDVVNFRILTAPVKELIEGTNCWA